MAGIFGFFDYTKPGAGVPKNAPPKARIQVFFEVLGRRFWDLIKLNLLFTIFNSPAIVAAFIVAHFLMPYSVGNVSYDIMLRFIIGTVFLCLPVITVGPAQAGFTYILRNYQREEHAFLWWDFKDNALKNFKESMLICFIDLVVIIIASISINFYFNPNTTGPLMPDIIKTAAGSLMILAFVVYLMMHMYMYPMLVTFKLNVRQIYRNALIFSMLKFLPNLGILLVCLSVLAMTFWVPVIGFILFPLITVSLIGFITNFYVYPQLKKYMMDKADVQGTVEEVERIASDDIQP